jgi:anti-anti-sigma factor
VPTGRANFVLEHTGSGCLALHGEVDMTSVDLLARELAAETERGEDVRLDLSDLAFIDIAGLWVFHEAAVKLGRGGRTLTLVSPPPSVPRMLALLGWSEIASLRVQPSA